MALPELAALSTEQRVDIPFAPPSPDGGEGRSMAEQHQDAETLVLFIRACESDKWDTMVTAATQTVAGVKTIVYEDQAEEMFTACVKGSGVGSDDERLPFTADDAKALAHVWPKHVRTIALNHIISLNSLGTLAPLGRRAKT